MSEIFGKIEASDQSKMFPIYRDVENFSDFGAIIVSISMM